MTSRMAIYTQDVIYEDTSPRDIPIYLGATGPKMLELVRFSLTGMITKC